MLSRPTWGISKVILGSIFGSTLGFTLGGGGVTGLTTGGDTAFVSCELDGGVKVEVVDGTFWDCLLYMATTAITATIPTSHFHPEDEPDVPDEGFSGCCLDAATVDGVE